MKRNLVSCKSLSRSYSTPHSLRLVFRRHKPAAASVGVAQEQAGECTAIRVPVRFVFHHPTAQHVCVAGSFNDWNPSATPLVNLGGGRWLRLVWLPPGRYEYLFVAAGFWFFDPHAMDYVPNVYGTVNATVEVHAPSVRTKASPARILPFRNGRETAPARISTCGRRTAKVTRPTGKRGLPAQFMVSFWQETVKGS